MAAAPDPRRGSEFYENDRVREAYLEHRRGGPHSPNVVMEEPAFLAALGSVEGCRVLDLGCGDGATVGAVVAAGAVSYLGVDGSAGMIEEARRRDLGDRVDFLRCDLEDLELGTDRFDVVVSRMALHYVADLDAVVGAVAGALQPGGRLLFSVVHPVITSHDSSSEGLRTDWTVDRYFERGPREREWFGSTVTWHHRTIEDYVGLLDRHGFRLDTLSECEPSAHLLAGLADELERRRRVPLMLLLGGVRIGEA